MLTRVQVTGLTSDMRRRPDAQEQRAARTVRTPFVFGKVQPIRSCCATTI